MIVGVKKRKKKRKSQKKQKKKKREENPRENEILCMEFVDARTALLCGHVSWERPL